MKQGTRIHPTALVSDEAMLADNVEVGPYAIVHAGVRLARGVRIDAYAVIGGDPQDLAFEGGATGLEIGPDTVVREGAILHRATTADSPTRIGARCLIMGQTHIGHDCQVGDHVTIAQQAGLAGHVVVEEHAVIGGMAGVHQHVRIGRHAMVGGMAKVTRDVLPFFAVDGHPATHRSLNAVGLRRAGIPPAEYRALREAFQQLRNGGEPNEETGMVGHLVKFLGAHSKRGITPFRRSPAGGA